MEVTAFRRPPGAAGLVKPVRGEGFGGIACEVGGLGCRATSRQSGLLGLGAPRVVGEPPGLPDDAEDSAKGCARSGAGSRAEEAIVQRTTALSREHHRREIRTCESFGTVASAAFEAPVRRFTTTALVSIEGCPRHRSLLDQNAPAAPRIPIPVTPRSAAGQLPSRYRMTKYLAVLRD